MEEGEAILKTMPKDIIPEEEHHKITCPKIGNIDVFVQVLIQLKFIQSCFLSAIDLALTCCRVHVRVMRWLFWPSMTLDVTVRNHIIIFPFQFQYLSHQSYVVWSCFHPARLDVSRLYCSRSDGQHSWSNRLGERRRSRSRSRRKRPSFEVSRAARHMTV